MRRLWVVLLALLLLPATASAQDSRYSLAGGCFTLSVEGGPTERVRMQATGLGTYLLYREDRTFLAAQDDGAMAPAPEPSPAADWSVEEAGGGAFTLAPLSAPDGPKKTARFAPAEGCPEYPEAPLSARARRARAGPEYLGVGGLVEGHMHWMTYEYFGKRFHCGRPWHRYGIPYALPDCEDIEGPQGTAAPLQNALNYGNPAQPHDTSGYPKLTAWSASNLTYEGTYWRWIERAYLGGLRLMVMGVNENRELCELQAQRETNCNEMDTMRRGFKAVKELEDYADAQAGGPGKGFFQIVTDPIQARRVINQGRMAVVLEIETSEPFDCRGWNTSTLRPGAGRPSAAGDVRPRRPLDAAAQQVRQPAHGRALRRRPVRRRHQHGQPQQLGVVLERAHVHGQAARQRDLPARRDERGRLRLHPHHARRCSRGTAPTYPPAPHCNTRGLTPLGKHVVNRMMDLGMIVNPDHMSQAAVDDTLTLLETRRYSGVISPHGWVDPGNWPRIWKLGGVAWPGHSDADDYVKEWEEFRPRSTPYRFGWGYGADLGGLSQQPKKVDVNGSITYPFKSYDGKVTFDKQTTGERTFDYTQEGVAHYGLYADWFQDLRRIGGDADGEGHVGRRRGLPARCGSARPGSPRRAASSATTASPGAGAASCASAPTGPRCCATQASRRSARARGRGASPASATPAAAEFAWLSPQGVVELVGTTTNRAPGRRGARRRTPSWPRDSGEALRGRRRVGLRRAQAAGRRRGRRLTRARAEPQGPAPGGAPRSGRRPRRSSARRSSPTPSRRASSRRAARSPRTNERQLDPQTLALLCRLQAQR